MRAFWLLLLLPALSLGPAPHASEELEASRNKLKQIVSRLQQEQNALKAVQDKERSLLDEVEMLDRQVITTSLEQDRVAARIEEKQQQLPDLELRLLARQEELQRRKEQLGNHIRLVYSLGEPGLVKLAFASETVHQARQGLRYFGYLVHARQEEFLAYQASLAALNQTLAEHHAALQSLSTMQSELEGYQKQILQERNQKNTWITALQKDAQLKQKQIAELKKASEQMGEFVTNLQVQLEKAVLARKSFDNILERKGKLPHPTTLTLREKDPGLFYAGPPLTPVKAIFRGQVVYADWFRGYGLLIIVDHGEHVFTLYGHNQKLLVAQGDWVEAQDKIAFLGETGAVEGPGLYFEIRAKGKPDDPTKWLAKVNKSD